MSSRTGDPVSTTPSMGSAFFRGASPCSDDRHSLAGNLKELVLTAAYRGTYDVAKAAVAS